MGEPDLKYEKYREYISFIDKYKSAKNASTGSQYDANANVDNKNVATLQGEIPKGTLIGINRLLMHDKIKEMYGEDMADEYIRQLENHDIYKHDETSIRPYTYSAKEVVVAKVGESIKLISFEDLYDLCDEDEILVDEEKGVWCKYPANGSIQVMDKHGYTNVSRLVKKKRHRDLVRVKTAFGEDLIVTDNHPLIVGDDIENTVEAVNSKGFEQYRVELDINFGGKTHEKFNELSPWNVQQYKSFYVSQFAPKCAYSSVKNEVVMDREMGYLIGFFIGDGCYTKNENGLSNTISICQKDRKPLEELADIVYTHLGIGGTIHYVGDVSKCWNLRIASADFVHFLSVVCGIKHYAQYKTLPVNIYDYTEEFALGVIDGLIDSDGTVSKDGVCCIRLSSRTAIMQLTMLAHNLGFSGGNTIQNTPFGNNTLYKTNYTIFGYNWKIFEKDKTRLKSFKVQRVINTPKTGSNYAYEWATITNVSNIENGSFLQDNEYIYDITTDSHSFVCNGLWVHNCVSITMYPFLTNGLKAIGGASDPPKHLDSFCGSFINLVFAVASQFAGAVSTPEFLTYLDYFIRKEYGDDYYLHCKDVVSLGRSGKTIEDIIEDKFAQIVYSLNQPAAARDFQSVK